MTVDPHNLSGAYALDALDDLERVRFESHLADCPACASEVDGFVATSARLGTAAEVPLPPELRARVMEAVTHTPQQRPTASSRSRSGWRRIATRVTLAAATIALVVSAAAFLIERERASDLQTEQAQIAQVLSADDLASKSTALPGGGSVRFVRSGSLGKGVLVTRDLPDLDRKHDYQLWTIAGKTITSRGLLSDAAASVPRSRLVTDVSPSTVVAISVEPTGGSKQPTTKPIVQLGT